MKSLYRGRFTRLAFLWGFDHFSGCGRTLFERRFARDGNMLFEPNQDQRLRELQEHLRRARKVTPDLMTDVIARVCLRFSAHPPAATARVMRLIESGAFTDATLALLELELPQWKLRRLVYDGGEWYCAFSKQLALPAELDESVETSHEILPLAVLGTLVEARRYGPMADEGPRSVPQIGPTQGLAVCCDNFA